MLIRIDKLFFTFFHFTSAKAIFIHKYVTITVERLTDSDGCMPCSVYLKLHCTIFAFTRDLGLFTLIRKIALINVRACLVSVYLNPKIPSLIKRNVKKETF